MNDTTPDSGSNSKVTMEETKPATQVTANPRRAWVAGLLSLLQPGLGHVYAGRPRRGLAFIGITIALMPAMIVFTYYGFDWLSENLWSFMGAFLTMGLAFYVVAAVDGARTARQAEAGYVRRGYNRWYAYVGVVLAVALPDTATKAFIRQNCVEAFSISSASMEPTLLKLDNVLVDKRTSARSPKRGDVVVFDHPTEEGKSYLKRVVAVSGDSVELADKVLYINGQGVKEPFVEYLYASRNPSYGPVVVPAGSYFMLGDNRDQSLDSREWGSVPAKKIKGTVRSIWWSTFSRLDRIGMKVR